MRPPDWTSEDGSVQLYCADCMDILREMEPGSVDAVVTDPPYGVMLGQVINGQALEKQRKPYESHDDTPEYIRDVVVPAIKTCIEKFCRVIVTSGNRNMWMYPQPDDMGVWFNPAGTSRGKWGPSCVNTPILYYGKDPYRCRYPSSRWGCNDSNTFRANNNHPCPKPVMFMEWLVWRGSIDEEMVCDPFMGSGTTGVVCVRLGRRFIGIEIEPKYFEIAKKRIQKAFDDQALLSYVAPEPRQQEMFESEI